MYLSFNELSGYNEISSIINKRQCKKVISDFIKFIHLLKSKNLLDGISSFESLMNTEIFKEYGIAEWLKDSTVSKEEKRFLYLIWDKNCMYIEKEDYCNEFILDIDGKSYNGLGLGYALEADRNVLSISSNKIFQRDKIDGLYNQLDELTEKIVPEHKTIDNLYSERKIDDIKQSIKSEVLRAISSGQDLWEKRSALFPNLIFCNSVKDQLYRDPEKQHIICIIKRLEKLQEYFGKYTHYDIKDIRCNARNESLTVQSDPKLKEMRKFKIPDGSYRYFFDHISFTGKFRGGRIYFLPDKDNSKVCYIGYIGRHLKTKKF